MTFNKAQQEFIDNRFPSYGGIVHIMKDEFEKRLAAFKEISNEPDPDLYDLQYTPSDDAMPVAYTVSKDLTIEKVRKELIDRVNGITLENVKTYIDGEYLEIFNGDKWKVVKQ